MLEAPTTAPPEQSKKLPGKITRTIKPWIRRLGSQDTQERELTEEQTTLKNFFFQSFRFSQGDGIILQDKIFVWAKAKGHLEGLDIPPSAPKYILNIQVPTQHKEPNFFDRIFRAKNGTLKGKWRSLHHISKQQISVDEDFFQSFADLMLKKDIEYQDNERQRPSYDGIAKPDSIHDVHASFVRKYGLQKANTGSPIFDKLFTDLRPYFLKSFRWQELKEKWEENHRDPNNADAVIPFFIETAETEQVTSS